MLPLPASSTDRVKQLLAAHRAVLAHDGVGGCAELSTRARNALLWGRHSKRFEYPDNRSRLVEIAASYSRKELLDEPNVGKTTVAEIAAWLAGKSLALRSETSDDSIYHV